MDYDGEDRELLKLGEQMKDQVLFLGKILALSLAIALLIRYAIPPLNIPATPAVALFLVLTPMLAMTGLLIWRGKTQPDS